MEKSDPEGESMLGRLAGGRREEKEPGWASRVSRAPAMKDVLGRRRVSEISQSVQGRGTGKRRRLTRRSQPPSRSSTLPLSTTRSSSSC